MASGILIYIVISTIIYYYTHRKVLALKKTEGWESGRKEVLFIDTGFRGTRNEKILVSPWWFMIPVSIIAVNIILGLAFYKNMPERVPVHWNSLNQIDRWADKSYSLIFQMPVTELFMTGLMFVLYKAIGWAKQQISASNPEVSRERNRLFRLRLSVYMIFVNTIIVLIYTNIDMTYLGILNPDADMMLVINAFFTLAILVSAVYLAVSTGQGGSRIKLNDDKKEPGTYADRNDDRYWKWGMIYFNPKDPAIFIEKRFGVGWTINFGRPGAYIAIAGLIALIILIQLIISLLS
jgi:uncharacterized membrane protein